MLAGPPPARAPSDRDVISKPLRVTVLYMTTELRETEQKYEGDGSIVLPPLQGLPGVATVSDPAAETLVAMYYDSDDLRLLLAGVTLRRRQGGADAGCHPKLP